MRSKYLANYDRNLLVPTYIIMYISNCLGLQECYLGKDFGFEEFISSSFKGVHQKLGLRSCNPGNFAPKRPSPRLGGLMCYVCHSSELRNSVSKNDGFDFMNFVMSRMESSASMQYSAARGHLPQQCCTMQRSGLIGQLKMDHIM
jgi:hypothetical protein